MPYSAWTTQRTNLANNPDMNTTANVSQAGGSPAPHTMSVDSTVYHTGNSGDTKSVLRTITGAGQTGAMVYTTAVVPGATYFSLWVYSTKAVTFNVYAEGNKDGAYAGVGAGQATVPANVWTKVTGLVMLPSGTLTQWRFGVYGGQVVAGDKVYFDEVLIEQGVTSLGTFFSSTTPSDSANPSLFQYISAGAIGSSPSYYQTRTYTQPNAGSAVIPIKNLSTSEVLYGDRITSYRYEVLEHSNGVDNLVGTLDGVSDGSLSWTNNAAVKGTGKISVLDLETAQAGMLRVAQLKLASVRIRPVQSVSGLPENPLGTFLVENANEEWDDTGRVWNISLFDRCTVPQQDKYENSYAVPAGALILQTIKTILASCGEYIEINASSTLATSTGMVWEANTSKLKIINDLLDAAGYNALWMDGYGNFQVTPRVLPADRTITYEVLGIPRELRDGDQGIYRPDWSRERDTFDVPNKVIAVEAAGGEDAPALVGTWTNEDASSPFSYQARGRWIPHVLDSVDVPAGTPAERLAFLQARARATLVQMSAVQAQAKVEHLPIPVRVSDVLRFANKRAGVDSRHVITNLSLDLSSTGMMKSTLQEVVSL